MGYLPAAQAVAGTRLAVEYLSELYPVTVVVAGSAPLFDPAQCADPVLTAWTSWSA